MEPRIFVGDCVQGMRTLPDQSIDVVVTSPPYNLGIDYGAYDDNKSKDEYLGWCETWAREINRVLQRNGSFFLNLGVASDDPFFAFEVAKHVGQTFHLQNTIHWIKSISIETESDVESFGHFKPINSKRFLNDCHEYVFHFTPEGTTEVDRLAVGVPYADKSNIKRWAHTGGRDKRCRGNTWFVPYKTINYRDKERPHPATFPKELASKCIRLHGKRECVVMDPFLGIGHSALAAQECQELVDVFYGFDIDEEYVRVACELLGCGYARVPRRNVGANGP